MSFLRDLEADLGVMSVGIARPAAYVLSFAAEVVKYYHFVGMFVAVFS
jgi:hypothetical protein